MKKPGLGRVPVFSDKEQGETFVWLTLGVASCLTLSVAIPGPTGARGPAEDKALILAFFCPWLFKFLYTSNFLNLNF
jgi:hypothetical protein